MRHRQQQQQKAESGSCLTCFQPPLPGSGSDLLNAQRQDIAATLQKHFWFTETELKDASICPPCWEQISGFHKFYTSVEEFYKDRYPKPLQVNIKCEANDLAVEGILSQFEDENEADIKQEEDDENVDTLEVEVEVHDQRRDSDETEDEEDEEYKPPRKKRMEDDEANENGDTLDVDDQIEDGDETEDEEDEEYKPPRKRKKDDDDKNVDALKVDDQTEDEEEEKKPPRKRVRRTIKPKVKKSNDEAPKRKYAQYTRKTKEQRKKDDDYIKQHAKCICEQCETICETFSRLQIHAMKVHKNKRPFVLCCGNRYFKKALLYQHVMNFNDPGSFSCQDCNRTYINREGLKRHVAEFHASEEEQKYKCERCDKRFVMEFRYKLHLQGHEDWDSQKFVCPQCGKKLRTSNSLKTHIKLTHTEPTDFICDICAKGFHLKSLFLQHKQEHETTPDELKVQCEICKQWLKHRESWRRHMIRHHTTRDMTCRDCGHVAPDEKSLQTHKRRQHPKEKSSYACSFCPKTYNTTYTLKEHVAAIHTGEILYKCSFCDRPFNVRSNRRTHEKRMHPTEWLEACKKKELQSESK